MQTLSVYDSQEQYYQVGEFTIDIRDQLGKGQQGTVFRAQHKIHQDLCCKVIQNKSRTNSLEQELKIMKRVQSKQCENLVNVYEIVDQPQCYNEIYIFMEACDMDLEKYLKEQLKNPEYLTIDQMREIINQVISGYQVLRDLQIIHRDLKPENLLIKMKDGRVLVKIADFGVGKILEQSLAVTKAGTPFYQAPEILLKDQKIQGQNSTPYTDQCDIYSLGIIFYRMVFRLESPISDQVRTIPQLQNVVRGFKENPFRVPNRQDVPLELRQLIEKMLKFDPQERETWNSLYSNKFLNNQDFVSKQKQNIFETQLPSIPKPKIQLIGKSTNPIKQIIPLNNNQPQQAQQSNQPLQPKQPQFPQQPIYQQQQYPQYPQQPQQPQQPQLIQQYPQNPQQPSQPQQPQQIQQYPQQTTNLQSQTQQNQFNPYQGNQVNNLQINNKNIQPTNLAKSNNIKPTNLNSLNQQFAQQNIFEDNQLQQPKIVAQQNNPVKIIGFNPPIQFQQNTYNQFQQGNMQQQINQKNLQNANQFNQPAQQGIQQPYYAQQNYTSNNISQPYTSDQNIPQNVKIISTTDLSDQIQFQDYIFGIYTISSKAFDGLQIIQNQIQFKKKEEYQFLLFLSKLIQYKAATVLKSYSQSFGQFQFENICINPTQRTQDNYEQLVQQQYDQLKQIKQQQSDQNDIYSYYENQSLIDLINEFRVAFETNKQVFRTLVNTQKKVLFFILKLVYNQVEHPYTSYAATDLKQMSPKIYSENDIQQYLTSRLY